MSTDEVLSLFEKHDEQWAIVRSAPKLRWDTFPWPIFKRARTPEDITTNAVGAYVLSPLHPRDREKSNKDRIKDHIKRWHPDRFETQLLPKVNEEEQEKVKEGAGSVARALSDLLTRQNSSSRDWMD
ncbi:hypothetical protein PUNSTDRAFT_68218 [Punctularia strigosozonata HHB-11173 SS5]|uniref:uncharacterized protein n=1 Tax=Punctularia strigosozonata (strain HHB-11173) TaxID=741275 RepID=UPI000441833F|nr:uncharacterized protein PUNSTDRAFT_68218 [Punctularia strigosozonata HHB-11173 SS5]EIN09113.1 hypothetical protein PUNSTDRAFT_68218 [Punctularia strigosozonata HHB-11173 SS5]